MENQSNNGNAQESQALRALFIEELQDIYWAENHLVKNLPEMAGAATSEELKNAFETHLSETENQVKRLEQAFSNLGEDAEGKKCEAMNGLVKEAKEMIDDTESGTLVRDVALISCAQKVEHYEIASYGTLATLAKLLGETEAADLLVENLEEEKNTDTLLTQLAEKQINDAALSE